MIERVVIPDGEELVGEECSTRTEDPRDRILDIRRQAFDGDDEVPPRSQP